jgi:hypothetical protein
MKWNFTSFTSRASMNLSESNTAGKRATSHRSIAPSTQGVINTLILRKRGVIILNQLFFFSNLTLSNAIKTKKYNSLVGPDSFANQNAEKANQWRNPTQAELTNNTSPP